MRKTIHRRTLLQVVGSAAILPFVKTEPPIKLPKPVRVGIIGLEGHFSEVLKAARLLPELKITAVTLNSRRELERASGQPLIAAARKYKNFHRMLDAEKLDVVAICDENSSRASTIITCAERGLAIAAEKPLAISLGDLEAVKRTVGQSRVPLTMLLPLRFSAPYLAMKSIVDRGQIGEPVALAGQKSYQLGVRPQWMKERRSFGGTIPYIAVHLVDLMRFVSGREMVETAAFHSRVGFPEIAEMENNAAIIYRLDNGGSANVRLDYLRPPAAPTHGDDRLRIAGTEGVVEYQGDQLTLVTRSMKLHQVTELPDHPGLFADFLDSIYNGKKHLLPLQDAYRVTEIVLKSREAADTNQVIKL
ncbi:Gfo/Idh/MocA family oxidoreductase [Acidobacteria bacterium AH-259-L09]|nr:Gfo/Idh/MocA family oxidoreductase [Acidobacteria bacterium AH-259-L09]